METSAGSFPDAQALATALAAVLGSNGLPGGGIEVVRRTPNPYARTFPSEIVAYRQQLLGEGQVFCKYMLQLNEDHKDHASRGGIAYEAMVYDRVLRSLPLSVAAYHGMYTDPVTGGHWLIIQHVPEGVELSLDVDGTAMARAAAWVGRLHAVGEERRAAVSWPFLIRYDRDYYKGWAVRTAEYGGPWNCRFPWLHGLCRRFDKVVDEMLAVPATLIHGEYYPHNILSSRGAIYPIDWESAAIGVGEIDLAALTDDWPADVVRACERAYQQARWPYGPPAGFAKTLANARLYFRFRWLGDHPESLRAEDAASRLDELGSAAQELGLI